MDVNNALLNSNLSEEVYMKPPPRFPHLTSQICKVRRALYDLKQAFRAWFEKFSSIIRKLGFTSNSHDYELFVKKRKTCITLLILYVIIIGDDVIGISDLKQSLSHCFEMRLNYFLELEVLSDYANYYLSQAKYASDILARAGFTDYKIVVTLLETNLRFTPLDGTSLSDATLYRQLIGSLVYLTVTRPDIVYAVNIVSQFMSAPRFAHYEAVLRIIRYIKGTLFHGLYFSSTYSLKIHAYSDSNSAGDPTDRRYITGYCIFLRNSLTFWRSKNQSLVLHSSTKPEYCALADITQELI